MTEPVTRVTLLDQPLPHKVTAAVQVRRITLQPNVEGTSEGVTFLGYFLSEPNESPELKHGPPNA